MKMSFAGCKTKLTGFAVKSKLLLKVTDKKSLLFKNKVKSSMVSWSLLRFVKSCAR